MKKILSIATVIASIFTANSQNINYDFFNSNYQNIGTLLAEDNQYGTARFEAMSGAFGALGGDISAIDINPAGGSVSKLSSLTFSAFNKNHDISTNYYGSTSNSNNSYLNVSQGGGLLVFDANHDDWTRFALSFNVRLKKDFGASYFISGNSNRIFHDTHAGDTDKNPQFDRSLNQEIEYATSGDHTVMTVSFSALHQKKLHIGAAVHFHDVELERRTELREANDNANGDVLNTNDIINDYITGNGISFSLGFIYKPTKYTRIGLAYETPTWYGELLNDFREDNYHHDVTTSGGRLSAPADVNIGSLLYSFKTPSRITASGAYIFGKQGLISFDYTYKAYSNMEFGNTNDTLLADANSFFNNQLRNTHTYNIGTEWRFDKASLRAGYHYQKSQFTNTNLGGNTNKDNQKGISFGAGYNFGNFKFDLSYRKFENINYQSIYTTGDTQINNNTSRITGTVVFEL